MNTHDILVLALISAIPVVASFVLYFIEYNYMRNVNYLKKQIILGVLFGCLSILGTEFGHNINGATINVRDAAPVIAGLVFGGPAGIIAGIIGGVERWFAVYWGAGTYTRLACSFSTIIAGIFAAVLRKNVFEDKIPKNVYALATGIVIEVFHMSMVFITNFNEPEKAFNVVKVCTAPMVIINSLAIFIAVYLIHLYRHIIHRKYARKTIDINRVFQRNILIIVIVAFIFTNGFTLLLQTISLNNRINNLLSENINDVIKDINDYSSSAILKQTQTIVNRINAYYDTVNDEYLDSLTKEYDVSEINIVNRDNIITISTNPDYVGFDMTSGEQSREFVEELKDKSYYAQELKATTYDSNVKMKYAAVKLSTGNYVQVGYDEEQYYNSIIDEVQLVAKNRHIGTTGGLVIIEIETNRIVSDSLNKTDRLARDAYPDITFDDKEAFTVYNFTANGTDYYCMYRDVDGYRVVTYQSVSEATQSMNISLYLSSFMQVMVFAGIFIVMFLVINKNIVNSINVVNSSLNEITEGHLDTTINVKNTREFESLSNGINAMVDKLKQLIHESEEKFAQELEYAAEIQRSALPSSFPAFPDRDEFDIYASMDPAKEVGGDFYDFYFVDGGKLAILVADVSGKGIPASLFMMKAKAIIKSYAQYGISVEDVFTNANYNLCEGNDAGLFVTAWMAVIDLATGHVEYANAGHNPPLIKNPDGKYEYLRTRPGFVLGGMEGVVYKKFEFDIEPGSEIFVYTDGLTEAQNLKQELYGEDRLLEAINEYEFDNSENICKYITKKVDEYVGEADQFDDLTMLHFKFIKKM